MPNLVTCHIISWSIKMQKYRYANFLHLPGQLVSFCAWCARVLTFTTENLLNIFCPICLVLEVRFLARAQELLFPTIKGLHFFISLWNANPHIHLVYWLALSWVRFMEVFRLIKSITVLADVQETYEMNKCRSMYFPKTNQLLPRIDFNTQRPLRKEIMC